MKLMKIMGIALLAFAVFAVPAMAETQTVKVSGSLDVKHIYREDYDLRAGNDQSMVPVGTGVGNAPADNSAANDLGDDGADWFMSVAQVEVAADLTVNVSVVINIYNQRDWNSNQWTIGANTPNTGNEF
ncbi:MAG: hypothetical protein HQL11_05335, partial [Candidatus Omnitrophica bacterium]|nr:hypothetical protein [Candidatus Omnitrophota bacterium]